MTDDRPPTLADDEASLARYAAQLADQVEEIAPGWLARLVASRAPGLETSSDTAAALTAAAVDVVSSLRELLSADIADQAVGPLELLRRVTAVPTALLAAAQVAPIPRDEFSRTNFPDDVYALVPASFGDIDPTLHEPGLMWGAAKAHVHLRRRREAISPDTEVPDGA